MYRFLATRRWLVRTLAGLVLVAVCVRLGIWQLDRNEWRAERNAVIEANVDAAPVPLTDLMEPDEPFDEGDQWRTVEVSGRYDADQQLLLVMRPLDGRRGVQILTPLVTSSGAALLVNRGFFPSDEITPAVPPPPSGEVDVVARVRTSETQRSVGGDPAAGSVRFINVSGIADLVPYPLYPAWAEALDPVDDGLVALPPPEVEAGPHLSYAVQWFIFATIGVVGFVLLVRAEGRGRRELASGADVAATEAPQIQEESPAGGERR